MQLCDKTAERQLGIKTIGQSNLTKLPHMVSLMVFARWRQYAPNVTHDSLGPP